MSYYIKFSAVEQEPLYDNYYGKLKDELEELWILKGGRDLKSEAVIVADACLKILKEHENIHWVLFAMFNLMPQKYCVCRNYEATAIALGEVAEGRIDYIEFKRCCGLL